MWSILNSRGMYDIQLSQRRNINEFVIHLRHHMPVSMASIIDVIQSRPHLPRQTAVNIKMRHVLEIFPHILNTYLVEWAIATHGMYESALVLCCFHQDCLRH